MKKILFTLSFLLLLPLVPGLGRGFMLSAQEETDPAQQRDDVDWSEKAENIVSIDDIVRQQQEATTTQASNTHFKDVWGRNGYFNIAYNSGELINQETVRSSLMGQFESGEMKFRSDWGVGIQVGHQYRLHKRAIANIVQFCIDYTFIDLNCVHYSAQPNAAGKCFSSNDMNGSDNFYYPWHLGKYDFNYAMRLGPSLIIAPFTHLSGRGIHYLKINVWYHFGYQAGLLLCLGDEDADLNPGTSGTNKTHHDNFDEASKLQFGHGYVHGWGLSLSWKAIGVGYEHRNGNMLYQKLGTGFEGGKTRFTNTFDRFFINFRF